MLKINENLRIALNFLYNSQNPNVKLFDFEIYDCEWCKLLYVVSIVSKDADSAYKFAIKEFTEKWFIVNCENVSVLERKKIFEDEYFRFMEWHNEWVKSNVEKAKIEREKRDREKNEMLSKIWFTFHLI